MIGAGDGWRLRDAQALQDQGYQCVCVCQHVSVCQVKGRGSHYLLIISSFILYPFFSPSFPLIPFFVFRFSLKPPPVHPAPPTFLQLALSVKLLVIFNQPLFSATLTLFPHVPDWLNLPVVWVSHK